MNWASELVGLPHARDGVGPAAFSCWGLMRHYFKVAHQVDMPHVAVGEADENNVRAIKQAAHVSGWRPVADAVPQPDDIVLMHSTIELHCGLVMRANGAIGVLHSSSATGVVWQPWREATAGVRAELWRRTP